MINPDTGAPHTAHTTNPVPFIMTGNPKEYFFSSEPLAGSEEGEEVPCLADVAPTILDLMVRTLWWFPLLNYSLLTYHSFAPRAFPSLAVSTDRRVASCHC